jgi:hypothetical protein
MNGNAKVWLGIISSVTLLVGTISGYIYAEGCGSRDRDTTIMSYVVDQDTKIRADIARSQVQQLSLLQEIHIAMAKVQRDVAYIKESR